LVEHDINAIFTLADRLTVMVDGEVIDCGLPNEVRENPRVQEAYLGES
jgi:branched-chain amino acid transport system ATP-binding protein